MKTKHLLALALGMGLGLSAMADTANVAVSASVTGTCKFDTTVSAAVSFTLDPSSTGDATGTYTQPKFWCTKGSSYTISDDGGLHNSSGRRMSNGATTPEYIPYTFTYTTTGTGAGKSSPITMNIAATVLNANFINASAGNYSDTVQLTITP